MDMLVTMALLSSALQRKKERKKESRNFGKKIVKINP
jgi:hypothetical protein